MCRVTSAITAVHIRQQSRGISDDIAEAALEVNGQEIPDEFNYGLTKRKVIYRAYPGCYPSTPAVDWENYDGEPIVIKGQPQVLKQQAQSLRRYSWGNCSGDRLRPL